MKPQNLRETRVTCGLVHQDQQDGHSHEVWLRDWHGEEHTGCVAGDWVGITAAEQGPASVAFGNGPGLEAMN